MSRANLAKPAVREAMKARLFLSGPSGSGKTRTALTIATSLIEEGGKIVLVDTEVGSSRTYADDFTFDYVPWEPPYNPRELGDTVLDLAKKYDVVIIDSLSHFWNGEGGTLDIADGKFGGWKDATPAQDDMVMGILRAQTHMILCARAKQSYSVTVGPNGKQQVEKVGLAPIQREGFEYELNVSAAMDMAHNIVIDKTRCSRLAGRTFRPGRGASELADIYGAWLASGEPLADRETISDIVARLNQLPDAIRKTAKSDFVTTISRPELLRAAQVDEAIGLVERYEKEASGEAHTERTVDPETVEVQSSETSPQERSDEGAAATEVPATEGESGIQLPRYEHPMPPQEAIEKLVQCFDPYVEAVVENGKRITKLQVKRREARDIWTESGYEGMTEIGAVEWGVLMSFARERILQLRPTS